MVFAHGEPESVNVEGHKVVGLFVGKKRLDMFRIAVFVLHQALDDMLPFILFP